MGFINNVDFQPAGEELFLNMPDGLRQQMTLFYAEAIQSQTSREDYKELLQLCHIFLGGYFDKAPQFRAPGAQCAMDGEDHLLIEGLSL